MIRDSRKSPTLFIVLVAVMMVFVVLTRGMPDATDATQSAGDVQSGK
jgi:hypothetical protein